MDGGDHGISQDLSHPEWYATFIAHHVSLPSTLEDLDAAQTQLDRDEAFLSRALAAVRNRRNDFARVHRILPECLAEIFSCLADIDAPRREHLGWMVVTHVCRHWRQVALDHPRLWARDVCWPESWMIRNLKRSKQAPITINMRSPDFQSITPPESLRLALREMGRVKHLNLTVRDGGMGEICKDLARPAPLLASFAIDTMGAQKLPDDLFQRYTPRLHTLHLSHTPPPLSAWIYTNLTTAIFQRFSSPNFFPSPDNLLEVLEAMPQIQTLTLNSVLTSTNTSSNRTVHLLSLISLCIMGPVSHNFWILHQLSLPDFLHLRVTSRTEQGDHIPSVERLIPRALRPDYALPRRPRTFLLAVQPIQISLRAWDVPLIDVEAEADQHSHTPILDIVFDATVRRDVLRLVEHLPTWLQPFLKDKITSLHLCYANYRPPAAGFFDAVRLLPSIENLVIDHGLTAVHIAKTMTGAASGLVYPSTGTSRPILFPRLRRLTFVNVDFAYKPNPFASSIHRDILGLVLFMARHPSYSALERVRVVRCRTFASWMNELRTGTGLTVDWDGEEKGCQTIKDQLQDEQDQINLEFWIQGGEQPEVMDLDFWMPGGEPGVMGEGFHFGGMGWVG